MINKIYVLKKDSLKAVDYTIRFFVFNPTKRFVSTPEAKDMCRKDMHCSKKKMEEEYDSVYAFWMKIGHGRYTHIEFNKTTKDAANVIFIVPKKHRKRTWDIMKNMELPYDKKIFK